MSTPTTSPLRVLLLPEGGEFKILLHSFFLSAFIGIHHFLYLPKYLFGILEHYAVFKAQYRDACRFRQVACTLSVILFPTGVRRSIQLYRQPQGRTIEIQNIRSHTMLPSEFQPFQLPPLQQPPKDGFCRSQCLPKLPTPIQPLCPIHPISHTSSAQSNNDGCPPLYIVRPRCLYASSVTSRPRGVRLMKPSLMRNGS